MGMVQPWHTLHSCKVKEDAHRLSTARLCLGFAQNQQTRIAGDISAGDISGWPAAGGLDKAGNCHAPSDEKKEPPRYPASSGTQRNAINQTSHASAAA